MKAKLFTLLGLIIASTGLALILGSAPAQAAGEKYKWIDANTIQASGGLYENVTAANNGVLNFPKNGNTFVVFSDGDCDITLTIAPSPDNKTGKLTTQGCDEPAKGFDRDITIADSEKGPPVGTFPAPTETGDEGEKAEDKTSCAVDGIGWIVCPILTFMSRIVDAAYDVVATLLSVQPLVTTGEESSKNIYNAWSIMRNFANVAFVIAFLFIIFSQISSIGITNYGIKKMLPRLVISAVLVNISFWICAVAIDASNIAGASIKELFDGLGASFGAPTAKLSSAQTGTGMAGIAGAVLATGAVVGISLYIGLAAFLPIIIAALVAIITVFLVLALRQALIILLVVIAPLAFVAYLLPNTEGLFKKWRGLLQTLLLMYPIIALIFGASALASSVIMATANADSALGEAQKITMQIMGAGVAIIPLALTPIVMKTAGGVLNRFGGFINNPNKGPFDRMKKGAEGYRKNRQQLRDSRALNGGPRFGKSIVKRQALRRDVLAQREKNYNKARAGYTADTSLSDEVSRTQKLISWATAGDMGGKTKGDQLLDQMAKGGGVGARSGALANAISTQRQLQIEEIKAHHATVDSMDETKLMETIHDPGSSDTKVAAAIERLVQVGSMKNIEEAVDAHAGGGETAVTRSLAAALQKDGPQFLKASDIDSIARGQMTDSLKTVTSKNVEDGVLSQEKMVASNSDQLKYASDNTTAAGHAKLQDNAKKLKANETLRGKIKHNGGSIDQLEATGVIT